MACACLSAQERRCGITQVNDNDQRQDAELRQLAELCSGTVDTLRQVRVSSAADNQILMLHAARPQTSRTGALTPSQRLPDC